MMEFRNLYASSNITSIMAIKSRAMWWAGDIARTGEVKKAYKILVDKSEGKTPDGSSGCRWENNIRMDRREIGWQIVDWIQLA
jgi:hypothetical protein